MVIINNFEEYQAFEGKEIGASNWHKIDQAQINRFADATIDHQWIQGRIGSNTLHFPFAVSSDMNFRKLKSN